MKDRFPYFLIVEHSYVEIYYNLNDLLCSIEWVDVKDDLYLILDREGDELKPTLAPYGDHDYKPSKIKQFFLLEAQEEIKAYTTNNNHIELLRDFLRKALPKCYENEVNIDTLVVLTECLHPGRIA